jgi:hypothetical protein
MHPFAPVDFGGFHRLVLENRLALPYTELFRRVPVTSRGTSSYRGRGGTRGRGGRVQ